MSLLAAASPSPSLVLHLRFTHPSLRSVQDINDKPPKPNQPPSNPQLAPRLKVRQGLALRHLKSEGERKEATEKVLVAGPHSVEFQRSCS